MTEPQSSKSPLNQLKASLCNKWRIGFFCFALAYAVLLLLNLVNTPMQWDEVVHLNGGLYLNYGMYDRFINNAFYPPLYDAITLLFFKTLGVSLFAARLVPTVFSLLSLWALFELAYSMYNGKTAILASVLLGIMPAYFWLSRLTLLETMLGFFITLALLFFYRWIQGRHDKWLVFTGIAVGLGFLTKYQVLAAGIVLVVSLLSFARGQLREAFKKFGLTIVTAMLVIAPWMVIAYEAYRDRFLSQWLYALQVGNPERLIYSERYPSPIYYLIEMVWPYDAFHPISIFIYVLGLLGLGLLAWRHNKADKYTLIWFVAIYVFFSLITNKEWRYVLPLFPALAISAAALIVFVFDRIHKSWKTTVKAKRRPLLKVAAGLFAIFIASSMVYSSYETYSMVEASNFTIDIEGATHYALANMTSNESIMLLCPFNFFSQDMVKFYLWQDGENSIRTYQYPVFAVDGYTPDFNITELIAQCRQYNVKYVFTYEYGGTVPYYNTTLNLQQVYMQLYASGNFSQISSEATFGANPRRIFVLTFLG
jgi:hypothetical protein